MANAYPKSRIRKIVGRFGLIPLRSDPIASFYRKNAVVRVRTASGTYAMKPFIRSNLLPSGTKEQIAAIAGYIQRLTGSGFGHMPRWLASDSGKLWTLNQGRPFYVTEWINGRSMDSQEDFAKLGRALAALHTTFDRSPPVAGPFFEHVRLWQRQDRLFRARMAAAQRKKSRTREWYERFGEACNRISDRSWTELSSAETIELLEKEKWRPSLTHGDITSQNVLIADDGQLFIIDWDRMKPGSAYADVAIALMNTTRFNLDLIRSMLNGYEELRPLDRSERCAISSLYRLPREAWHAVRFPNRPSSRSMLRIIEETWPLRLKAMEALDEWANRP